MPLDTPRLDYTAQGLVSGDRFPSQVVLVLQGGGALGAYQVGVYEALHESGIEPDWVIGTSIGAINGAIIAGNPKPQRLEHLLAFWNSVAYRPRLFPESNHLFANFATIMQGIPSFFSPNPTSWHGLNADVGIEQASYYLTAPLRDTLHTLIDLECMNNGAPRLTVGAVNARSGDMRYFDSRDERLRIEHVIASGSLPPAFPAVRIDGEPYWDGGIYSNTPLEAVLDDRPRHDSVIFSVQIWNPNGPEPASLWQVMGKQKDIQYASRASHIERQKQIHHLRHVIRELGRHLSDEARTDPECQELMSWGCGTIMHIIKLNAPPLAGEDHTKDIDFSADGIASRRAAGYEHARQMISSQPWETPIDPAEGVMLHEAGALQGQRME
jgi:NTE family protein